MSLEDQQALSLPSQGLAKRIQEGIQGGGVDFHMHSTCSDGTYAPEALAALVLEKGLKSFALTDHDCLDGIPRIEAYLENFKDAPSFIPGIELTVDFESQELHLLGYFPSFEQALGLTPLLDAMMDSRLARNDQLLEGMRDAGLKVSLNDLEPFARHEEGPLFVSRVHVAKYLVQEGMACSIDEAFACYLSEGCPFYVPRKRPDIEGIIISIALCQGLSFLAHPKQYGWLKDRALLRQKLSKLKAQGLFGLEVYHQAASTEEQALLKEEAMVLKFPMSGGSDFHGLNKPTVPLYTAQTRFL